MRTITELSESAPLITVISLSDSNYDVISDIALLAHKSRSRRERAVGARSGSRDKSIVKARGIVVDIGLSGTARRGDVCGPARLPARGWTSDHYQATEHRDLRFQTIS